MKFQILSLLLLSTTSAFAGAYEFDCASADGSIRISNQGQTLKINETELVSTIEMKGFEDAGMREADAHARVKGIGRAKIMSSTKESCPREMSDITFAQSVVITGVGKVSFQKIETVLLCRELSVSTPNRDCNTRN